jgi:hypothetical protein
MWSLGMPVINLVSQLTPTWARLLGNSRVMCLTRSLLTDQLIISPPQVSTNNYFLRQTMNCMPIRVDLALRLNWDMRLTAPLTTIRPLRSEIAIYHPNCSLRITGAPVMPVLSSITPKCSRLRSCKATSWPLATALTANTGTAPSGVLRKTVTQTWFARSTGWSLTRQSPSKNHHSGTMTVGWDCHQEFTMWSTNELINEGGAIEEP